MQGVDEVIFIHGLLAVSSRIPTRRELILLSKAEHTVKML
jgi:hypothetical protein